MNTDSAAGYGRAVTDRGRRLAAAHETARAADGSGRWIAVRISDGGWDGNIYDRREQAIARQFHETQCAYVLVQPGQMPEHEATVYLEAVEKVYDGGYRLTDPEAQPMVTAAALPTLNRAARRRAARDARHRHPAGKRLIIP